jgi:glutathione S-transferase
VAHPSGGRWQLPAAVASTLDRIPATLYSLSLSHPSLAVRCMLRRKGIPHRVVQLVPGFHPIALRGLGFPGGTVPALVIDGRRIQGSRAISRALDEIRPDPPLFPREPDARRRVEEAERWGEQELQYVPRRLFRFMAAHHYEVRRWLAVDVTGVPLGGLVARPSLQARAFARAVGADEAAVHADLAALGSHLAEVERLRAQGVLGTDRPNAADFQIATSLQSIAKLGDLAPYLREHRTIRWAAALVPALPGPTPAVLPREWLSPLEQLA